MRSRTDAALREVIAEVAPALRDAGFVRSKRRFNRTTEHGLVQVAEFEAGRYTPPGMGWGEYGRFTINLGVSIDEPRPPRLAGRDRAPVRGLDWNIRARIGDLLPEPADVWWEMFESNTAGTEARDALVRFGLPWLDRLRTREQILAAYERADEGWTPILGLSALDVALLRFRRGEQEGAANLIAEYLEGDLHLAHRRHVVDELLPSWGLGHLVPAPDLSRWPRRSSVEFTTDAFRNEGAQRGTAGVVVEVRPDGYLIQVIGADGWGPLVGPVPDSHLSLLHPGE